jgi:hypothetical protein
MTTNVLSNPTKMVAGERLQPQLTAKNYSVLSPSSRYALIFQTDGNLVLYGMPGYKPVLYASNTNQSGISRLDMQADGNLVIYGNDSKPKWATDTQGHPGAELNVLDSGDAVIVDPTTGQQFWSAVADRAAGIQRKKSGNDVVSFINQAAKAVGIKVNANIMASAKGLLPQGAQAAFDSASKMIQDGRATLGVIQNMRGGLSGDALKGFDMAASLHIGANTATPPSGMTPDQLAGFYATHGVANGADYQKAGLVGNITASPGAASGAVVAAGQIKAKWWHPVLRVLTLGIWKPHVAVTAKVTA